MAVSGPKNKNVEILENDDGLSFTFVQKRTEGFFVFLHKISVTTEF